MAHENGGMSLCTCGHTGDGEGSQHEDTFQHGHGACKLCDCERFTWKEFLPGALRILKGRKLGNPPGGSLKPLPQVGDMVSEVDAMVIAVQELTKTPPGIAPGAIIMCWIAEQREYAVWFYNRQTGGCHQGDYFHTGYGPTAQVLRSAVKAFEERSYPYL